MAIGSRLNAHTYLEIVVEQAVHAIGRHVVKLIAGNGRPQAVNQKPPYRVAGGDYRWIVEAIAGAGQAVDGGNLRAQQ
jgi:hypothetical protein